MIANVSIALAICLSSLLEDLKLFTVLRLPLMMDFFPFFLLPEHLIYSLLSRCNDNFITYNKHASKITSIEGSNDQLPKYWEQR